MFYFATFKEMKQYTNHIIMIKPIKFQYNSETAVNNFKGIDRIVPIGKGLDMNFLWDGYNLDNILSREIEIK